MTLMLVVNILNTSLVCSAEGLAAVAISVPAAINIRYVLWGNSVDEHGISMGEMVFVHRHLDVMLILSVPLCSCCYLFYVYILSQ